MSKWKVYKWQVVVIALYWEQYGKYFSSFSYFTTYFTKQRAITTLSLNACLNQMNQQLSYLLTDWTELA